MTSVLPGPTDSTVASPSGGRRQTRPVPARKYQISSTVRWRTGSDVSPAGRRTDTRLAHRASPTRYVISEPSGAIASGSLMPTTLTHAVRTLPGVEPGLCAECRHARVVSGANSRFWLCERSRTDARFPRYPRLPVRRCPGFEPGGLPEPGVEGVAEP